MIADAMPRSALRLLQGAVLVFFVVFPAIANDYQTGLLAKFLVFGIFALSLDLIWGCAGIVNFGHAIFFGFGAYAMGVVLKFVDVPGATYLAIIAAVLFPMALSLVLGYLLFYGRVSGVFFGVVTLALTGAAHSIIVVNIDITGGMNGLYGYQMPKLGIPGIWEFELFGAAIPYYSALIGALACYAIARRIIHSDFGRIIKGIKENEERIEFLGYNVPLIKLMIFTIACSMAGFSGALYVPIGFISPDLVGILMSASVLVWVTVGGRGTLIGAFIGALTVNYLQTLLSDQFVIMWALFVGLFFIGVVLFWPGGLVGLVTVALARWRSYKSLKPSRP